MKPPSDTTIVVPCYNEARRLQGDEFLRFLERTPSISLLFVDDGSTDATSTVLGALERRSAGRAGVLPLPRNEGKGEAVRRGLLAALESEPRFVGYWDADLSTPLETILTFRDQLLESRDVDWVLGSRVRMLGRSVERRSVRHYSGRVFATAAAITLRLPVYDTQCGAKLFRATSELQTLLAEPFGSRWVFDVELLARLVACQDPSARDLGGKVIEYPLKTWRHAEGSKLRLRHRAIALWELMRIRMRYSDRRVGRSKN
jgi:glycosyltransferase involved in cell wall biosynthesis